ncbi:MAG: glycosyltransferase family 2 protein [Myxococcales bacterium]|nr:glycosyltransferase family 2 protein [Myxococcales bacterium]
MLALVVIAKDEADRIGRCLRSVAWASERVVLVDASSQDATVEVARREGARVVVAPWAGHVAQKNHALSLAREPWVLSLDADEWLTERAGRSLRRALQDPGAACGFAFARRSEWLGRPMGHGKWYPDRKLRVVRAGLGAWVGDDPHDLLQVEGPVHQLVGDIGHQPYRTIWEHLSTIDRYTRIHAEALARRGARARPWDPAAHAALHWVDAMLLKAAWRDGLDGLAVATLGAVYSGLKWHRLRVLQREFP